MTEKNKHFLPLAAPSPADWAIVGSDQKTIAPNKVRRNKHQIHDQPRQWGHKRQMLHVTESNGQTLVLNCSVGDSQLLK